MATAKTRTNADMDPIEKAYIDGQRDALRFAIAELRRGPWWHFRDWLARGLHWLAMHVEPKT